MAPSEAATAQPSFSVRSTSTSSAAEVVPGDAEAAVGRAPRTRRPPAPCAACRARRRGAGRARGGSGAPAARWPRPDRRRPPSPAARRRSRPRGAAARSSPSATRRRSGCRVLHLRGGAGLAPELDEPAHRRDLLEQVVVGGRSSRASRRGTPSAARPGTTSAHEDLPEVLGEERHDRRHGAQPVDERRSTACAAPPRRRPRSGGATGGCTSSTGRRRTPRRRAGRSR